MKSVMLTIRLKWFYLTYKGIKTIEVRKSCPKDFVGVVYEVVSKTNFGMPRRTAAGTDYNRVNLLMAVLEKRLGYPLSDYDAYVNIAGGLKISEPALDLGIVIAIISSYRDRIVDDRTIVFGEVGLSGEVRAVSNPEQRVMEAVKLGFDTCIMPQVSLESIKKPDGIKLIGIKNIKELQR